MRLLMFLEDYRFGIHVEASGKSNSKSKTATVSIEMNDADWSVLVEIYSTVRKCMHDTRSVFSQDLDFRTLHGCEEFVGYEARMILN